jgi:XisI protein
MGTLIQKKKFYQTIVAKYVEQLALQYAESLGNDLEYQAIIDLKNNHFQLARLGWSNRQFFYQILLHLDIKADGKVWIQQNNTEILVGETLAKQGILRTDMVLGFRPQYLREQTEFATA